MLGAVETNATQKKQSVRDAAKRAQLPPRVKSTPPALQTPPSPCSSRAAPTSTATRAPAPTQPSAHGATATNTSYPLRTTNSSQPAVTDQLLQDGTVAPVKQARTQNDPTGKVPAEAEQTFAAEIAKKNEQAKRQLEKTKEIIGAMSEFVRDHITGITDDANIIKTDRAKIVRAFEEINALLIEFNRAANEKKPDGKKADKKNHEKNKKKEEAFLDGGHEAARNCFREIAKICNNISLKGSENTAVQTTFDQLGGLSEVLKRFHFTQSANYRTQKWAETMANNLGKICPGLLLQRPGSEISQSTEFGVGVSASFLPQILSIGPKAVCRAMVLKTNRIDEDGDTLYLTSKVTSVEAGVQAKVMKIPNFNNKQKSFLSISFKAKGTRERGNYADFKSLVAQMMAENRDDANYWKFFNRSGSENSFGSRLVAVMQLPGNLCWRVAVGKGYKSPGRMPNFNQEKLNKGATNQDEILSLSSQLFGDCTYTQKTKSTSSIHGLFKHCYPSAAMELKGLQCDYADSFGLPDVPRNPLEGCTPKPTPGGLRSRNNFDSVERDTLSLELKGNFGVYLPGGTGNQFQLGADASMKVERVDNKTVFMKFLLPHHILDPFYSFDIQGSHDTLSRFENMYANGPESHLFCTIRQQLHRDRSRADALNQISAMTRIDLANDATNKLFKLYTEFVDLAGIQKSLQTNKTGNCRFRPDELIAFESKFEKVCNEIFGIHTSPILRKQFGKELRRDPEFFIVRGLEAISIALGQVGLHIHDTKMQAGLPSGSSQSQIDMLHEAREKVERKYALLSKIMDGFTLPMDEQAACRQFSIIPPSKSINTTYGMSVDLNAGAYCSALSYINNNSIDPTKTSSVKGQNPVQGQSGIATPCAVGGGLQMFLRKQPVHPNLVRSGTFKMVKLTVNGTGLMGPVLSRAHDFMVEIANGAKKRLNLLDQTTTADKTRMQRFVEGAAAAFVGSTVSVQEHEKEWSWNERTPLAVGKFTYQPMAQWARVISRKSNSISAAVGVPLHPTGTPVTVSLSCRHTETASNVVFESLGTCLGYQLIQNEALDKIVKQCGVTNKTNDPNNKWALDFNKLRVHFTPEKAKPMDDLAKTNQKLADTTYMCNKYFATDESVFGFMESYLHYAENPRSWDGVARENIGKRNEFHRFDDDPDTWRTIRCMNEGHGGSALASTTGQTVQKVLDLRKGGPENLDPRPIWSKAKMAELKKAMKNVKMALENKSLSPDERRELFFNTPDGQIVFEAYNRVLSSYNNINTAVKATTTYQPVVVKRKRLPA